MAVHPLQSEQAAELQSVLSSRTFSKCPNLGRLLLYLCESSFSGNGESLKEYRIGTEALGRPSSFDPAENSIVRVEVHRLRQKLQKYYATEGANDSLRIALEGGCYVPQFVRREDAPAIPPSHRLGEQTPGTGEGSSTNADAHRDEDRKAASAQPLTADANSGRILANTSRWRSPINIASLGLIAALVAILIALVTLHARRNPVKAASIPPTLSAATLGATTAQGGAVRILAGYLKEKYVDREGNVWSGDRYFSGGNAGEQTFSFLQGTTDPTMFRTSRIGDFRYDIPLTAGNYELRLHFAETNFGPGTTPGRGESSRVFSVAMNGKPLLNDLDIYSAAGGNNQAYVRVFKDVSPALDGRLHLEFHSRVEQPLLNAIELVPQIPGVLNPVRIVAQEDSYTDEAGRLWEPDRYASGGILVTHPNTVTGASDRHLFDGERFGHFTYSIPVAPGKYTVTLHFAETYFTLADVKQEGEDVRLFDVYANGEALLRNFNIIKSAGGPGRAVTRTFHGLQPNTAGLIVLSFVPVNNYACISAIEVTDENQSR